MYQKGDQVVYGIHGVCTVVDQEEQVVDRKRVKYLVLEPVGQTGSRYMVPTHNSVAMSKLRRMMSREELEATLSSEAVRTNNWIKDENLRKQTYRELINSTDQTRLLGMVRTLYMHKADQTAAGKKCHMCDDNFLRDAEKLLAGEISLVLDLPYDQAKAYLKQNLK